MKKTPTSGSTDKRDQTPLPLHFAGRAAHTIEERARLTARARVINSHPRQAG
jgi:hypothetical protein